MRHSCEHVLTQAMLRFYPDLKMAMGPPTDEGFYSDFSSEKKISELDFPKIEEEMRKIIKADLPFIRKELSVKDARKLFAGNEYKQEWLDEIEDRGEKAVVYWTGNPSTSSGQDLFVDLCSGPHVSSTGKIGPFKLLSIAGAYWRGDEKNKMLTRIYGTCFPTKKELDKYLWRVSEAKKRDHRKLGKELGLFIIPNEVGPGLLIWSAKGAIIRREIENFIISEQTKRGYQHVYSPHIGRKSLWVTSGHWDLYRDKMYAPMKIDKEDYLIKPMNCPMHMMVYKSQRRSYRELPLRIAENATVYRYEQTGELSGMVRVRYITQDDSHIFCRSEQVVDELVEVIDYINYLLKTFKIYDFYFRLSLRDLKNKDKYLGNDLVWHEAERKIKEAVKKSGLRFKKVEGEAAFYGPKLDVMIKDVLGREWQCGTVQIDFMLPKRFKLEYIDEKGKLKKPALIHRAPLGSLERWVGLLIEHYAGAFPLWLSPVQVSVLPISSKVEKFAQKVNQILKDNYIRVELNEENKTLAAKIRESTLQKIPYMIIIGEKELKRSNVKTFKRPNEVFVSVRTREGEDLGLVDLYEFTKDLKEKIENKL